MTPDKAQEQAKLDAGLAAAGDMLPPLWRRLYDNCLLAGFDERQALLLVQTHIIGAAGGRLQ